MNALFPIVVSPEGNTTEVKAALSKASSPMTLIDDGIFTAVTWALPNAPFAIDVAAELKLITPIQPVLPVMTPDAMVYVPPPEQGTVPLEVEGVVTTSALLPTDEVREPSFE